MHAAACETGDSLITLIVRLLRVIGYPALYAQAGLGAAVKECDHGLIMESGRDRIVQVPRSCDGSVRAAHPLAISPWATLKLYTLAA
jgi:hypothetical protein